MQAQSPKNAPIDMKKWRELINTWGGSGESIAPSSAIILENPRGYKLHLPASLSLDQFTNNDFEKITKEELINLLL